MTDLRKAAQAALEALDWMPTGDDCLHLWERQQPALKALRAALAQPSQTEQQSIPIPTNADAAAAMVLCGMAWLKEHAPERLKAQPEQQAEPTRFDLDMDGSMEPSEVWGIEEVRRSTGLASLQPRHPRDLQSVQLMMKLCLTEAKQQHRTRMCDPPIQPLRLQFSFSASSRRILTSLASCFCSSA
ncbi:MAG: hypothetical protein KA784_00005 [Aquabacterium sp.]|nr:hypothetical protein [Aquabacterium sp.]